MSTMSKTMLSGMAAVVFLAMVASASAAVVQTDSSSMADNFNSLISATDLVNAGQASLASATTISGDWWVGGAQLAGTQDGMGQTGVDAQYAGGVFDPIVWEYALNTDPGTGGSALGYDIHQVDCISGWYAAEWFANQSWSMSVATVGDPTTFSEVHAVSYSPFADDGTADYGYAHVRLTDDAGVIASGVSAIRFSAAAPNGLTIISEMDIHGTATVPEPSCLVMTALGLAGLLAYAWRKRR